METWAVGEAYERYMGRWSRAVAVEFLSWLGVPPGCRWLDVGCGTGVLTAAVLEAADPAEVVGVDPSTGFLATAQAQVSSPRARFVPGDAEALPLPDDSFDAVVSGLALNFVPDPDRAAAQFVRVATPGAVVAAYVWDYVEGMALIRCFWDAAEELDPSAGDEAQRFPLCQPDALTALWTAAGLTAVAVRGIEVPTVFTDFDDYWEPFLGGQGPAPTYTMALPDERRTALRELLRQRLPVAADGSIPLRARAWAVGGIAP